MEKIQIEILMLAESMTFRNTYTIVLAEKNGNRRFSIIIGKTEAQAIAVSLDGLKASRPLTHDLLHTSFLSFNIQIIEVVITKVEEGIFYSYITCKRGDSIIEIDSRASDALALALRFNCPIYTNVNVLNEVGTEIDDLEQQTIQQFEEELDEDFKNFENLEIDIDSLIDENEFDSFENSELEANMKKALSEEDYEYAARIRDELKKREDS